MSLNETSTINLRSFFISFFLTKKKHENLYERFRLFWLISFLFRSKHIYKRGIEKKNTILTCEQLTIQNILILILLCNKNYIFLFRYKKNANPAPYLQDKIYYVFIFLFFDILIGITSSIFFIFFSFTFLYIAHRVLVVVVHTTLLIYDKIVAQ